MADRGLRGGARGMTRGGTARQRRLRGCGGGRPAGRLRAGLARVLEVDPAVVAADVQHGVDPSCFVGDYATVIMRRDASAGKRKLRRLVANARQYGRLRDGWPPPPTPRACCSRVSS